MLRLRLASAAVLVPLVLIVDVVGQPLLTLVLALVAAGAAAEALTLLGRAGHPVQRPLGITIATLAVLEGGFLPVEVSGWGLITALGIIAAGVGAFAWKDPGEGVRSWLATAFVGLYIGLLGFVPRLFEAAPAVVVQGPLAPFLLGGRGWLLLLLFAVWAYDTGAYAAGRAWGRRRFLEHLSPSKTLEGVAGGTVVATAVTVLMLNVVGSIPAAGLLLGPAIAAAAQAGDLAESMLKRAAGAKDASALIPGHGGLLDRIDSILFAAPVAYLGMLVLDRIS
jgi:phosphatidate cytidylyltransferase